MNAFEEKEARQLLSEAQGAPKADDLDLVSGILYHNLAVSKPEAWADKAVASLKAAVARAGAPPKAANLARAYLGSATTLRAQLAEKAGNAMKATALLEEGFAAMDKAVEAGTFRGDLL